MSTPLLFPTMPRATITTLNKHSWINNFTCAVEKRERGKSAQVVIIVDHQLSFDLFEVFGPALVQLERCFVSTFMLIRDGTNTNCDDQSVHALIIKARSSQ